MIPNKTPPEEFTARLRSAIARLEAADDTIDTIRAMFATDLDAIRAEERQAIERLAEAFTYATELAAYRRHIEHQTPKVVN